MFAGWELVGHACLRTLQFLRAPSVIRDRRALENALGGRPALADPRAAGPTWGWLYRFALERGYLDGLLDRFVVAPFVRTFRWFDSLERTATDALAGKSAEPESAEPQPQPEGIEQVA
jgi:NAD(P)H-quinone oxidoreductase subunit 5